MMYGIGSTPAITNLGVNSPVRCYASCRPPQSVVSPPCALLLLLLLSLSKLTVCARASTAYLAVVIHVSPTNSHL